MRKPRVREWVIDLARRANVLVSGSIPWTWEAYARRVLNALSDAIRLCDNDLGFKERREVLDVPCVWRSPFAGFMPLRK
jgi:hypothetical protein